MTKTKTVKKTKLVLKTASGRRVRQQVRHDVHPRPRDGQAAAPDQGGEGSAEHGAGSEHVADAADSAGRQRAVQQARHGRPPVHRRQRHRRPTRTSRSRRRRRPTASRSRSGARTTRTTRRSTSCTPFEMMDWPASSYSPENQTFITCGVTDRAIAFEQIPRASQVVGAFGGIGCGLPRRGRHVDGEHRQLLRAERDDGQAGVAPALAGPVLQRLDEHGLRHHVHRLAGPGQRPGRQGLPRGAGHEDRCVALEVAADDRAGRRGAGHLHGRTASSTCRSRSAARATTTSRGRWASRTRSGCATTRSTRSHCRNEPLRKGAGAFRPPPLSFS